MKYILPLAALALAGCGGTIYEDRPLTVKVPVPVDCATERPIKPVPLKDKVPDWVELDVRQKAAHVGSQALEWQTYGEQLDAATAACK